MDSTLSDKANICPVGKSSMEERRAGFSSESAIHGVVHFQCHRIVRRISRYRSNAEGNGHGYRH
jgi:hypothetical protein